MIKTQNKYKLSDRAKSPRTFSPTLTLYKTVVKHYDENKITLNIHIDNGL
jgi:hypothetical protein